MTETFLHYIWKNRLFNFNQLKTVDGQEVDILNPGTYNTNAGPDFFNAQLRIDNTLWAGNVEIHILASDWIKHDHQKDASYDSCILHVVLENDAVTRRMDGSIIPAIELKGKYPDYLWNNFIQLISENDWVSCSHRLKEIETDVWIKIFDDKSEERLILKAQHILISLEGLKNDWEECFYQYLSKNFGFQLNGMPFEMLARSLPLKIIRKEQGNPKNLEALFYGQAGMLEKDFFDAYPADLKKRFAFLQSKYSLKPIHPSTWKFLRMRPVNFPTIRLAQMIRLLQNTNNLFALARDLGNVNDFYGLFNFTLHDYWTNHYLFDKESVKKDKVIGKTSIDNIIINTIIPFLYAWGVFTGTDLYKMKARELLFKLSPENNRIIEKWNTCGVHAENAGHSQALIQLKQYHCSEKKCLTCSIGMKLINTLP
ncbi:MAG: DUF2851 family protein [Bacteroidota bacterium]